MTDDQPDILDLTAVSLHRGRRQILFDVQWRIRRGEHWAILGANGSGKTTLLSVVTGYLWASRGQVTVLGGRFGRVDLRQLRRHVGLVSSAIDRMIQRRHTARQIVLSGAFASTGLWDEATADQRRYADELLTRMRCTSLADQPFGTLSLGEQQRVLIARALMPRPRLLLLDEPCAGLDLPGRELLLRTVDDLAADSGGCTLVLVTHHIEEITPRFTHVLVLKDGRALAAGPKADVLTAATLRAAFDLPIELDNRHGRYWPRVPGAQYREGEINTGEPTMDAQLPTRDEAMTLLKEFNQADRTITHALAVEAVMRHMARKRGEDEDVWGTIGLIHDLDYEQFPDEHCQKTQQILQQRGWPDWAVRAVVSHGWGICSDVQPQTEMEKVLFAVDELTGLVAATALVRPSKSVMDMKAKSVKKKWKDKRFAAGVSREIIQQGAEMLGIELSELITDTIMGMREAADQLGLGGTAGG